ncbi:type IV secretion system protein [Brevundimonas sp. BAL3]|uniref:type IV secretion system protein n=1 Tax=Brevundimonas sp. BAL3 TaxID=391600 RepID=UPI0003154416|nr:type IV secretion system protein [Brevundimonas sp. BAL3]
MAAPSMETPNELMVVFSNTVSAGFDALQGPINGIFGLMIVLVVALTGIQWMLSPNRDILAGGFGKILLIGVFAYIINDWQSLAETLQVGFVDLGLTAGGGSLSRAEFLNPGAILQQGWEIVKALGETPAPVNNPLDVAGNLTDALILGLAMIGIMLAFAVLALQIIVTLLEFKIVTLGGFVLLPFGIWSKSAFLAERPLGYVVSSGLKVLALAIVVSGARTVFDQLQPSANPDLYEALTILVASMLLAMLAIFIPNLASALVTGGPALGAGSAVTGALAVGGAGLLAGAGIAGAGAAAGGAASRVAGSARAAAGAGAGRPPTPPSAPPRPSNDNPSPSGPRSPASAGAPNPLASIRSAAGPSGVAEPATTWSGAPPKDNPPPATQGDPGQPAPARPAAQINTEAEAARKAFHKAAGATATSGQSAAAPGRAAAMQAFFVANHGRGLLPAGETSGAVSPSLRSEET